MYTTTFYFSHKVERNNRLCMGEVVWKYRFWFVIHLLLIVHKNSSAKLNWMDTFWEQLELDSSLFLTLYCSSNNDNNYKTCDCIYV